MTAIQDKKIETLMHNIYCELYANSTPYADFQKLIDTAELNDLGQKIIHFDDYEINEDLYDQIVNSHLKESRFPKWRKEAISRGILLGCSPKFKKGAI
jgi:hypothetical protein